MTEIPMTETLVPVGRLVSSFLPFWSFVLVSDFQFRISNFRFWAGVSDIELC
jgi:hypothetical protein